MKWVLVEVIFFLFTTSLLCAFKLVFQPSSILPFDLDAFQLTDEHRSVSNHTQYFLLSSWFFRCQARMHARWRRCMHTHGMATGRRIVHHDKDRQLAIKEHRVLPQPWTKNNSCHEENDAYGDCIARGRAPFRRALAKSLKSIHFRSSLPRFGFFDAKGCLSRTCVRKYFRTSVLCTCRATRIHTTLYLRRYNVHVYTYCTCTCVCSQY